MKKSIYQINKNQSISISCYQYSPESFKAYIKTSGLNPNIPSYEEIKITNAGELGAGYKTKKVEDIYTIFDKTSPVKIWEA